mmetsp:Transcript_15792/g.22564  ORF Transcript_15792/g.22564 Transcript_15792/m.22564 type:complete len:465 (+) Transcript_15792:188-1582(+)
MNHSNKNEDDWTNIESNTSELFFVTDDTDDDTGLLQVQTIVVPQEIDVADTTTDDLLLHVVASECSSVNDVTHPSSTLEQEPSSNEETSTWNITGKKPIMCTDDDAPCMGINDDSSTVHQEGGIPSNPTRKQTMKLIVSSRTPCFGGNGGVPFDSTTDDSCIDNKNILLLTGIAVRAGDIVDGITLFYHGGKIVSYGGNGGNEEYIFFCPGEYVTRVDVKFNSNYVCCLTFQTNQNRILGPCGGNGGFFLGGNSPIFAVAVEAPRDQMLVGLIGREGVFLDSIGFRFRGTNDENETSNNHIGSIMKNKKLTTTPRCYGGKGGDIAFDDGHYNIRIVRIAIRAGNVVDGISITYYTGKVVSYGGMGGNEESLTLKQDEWITEVHVRSSKKLVQCLTFITNFQRSLGPCGGKGFLLDTSTGVDETVKAPEGTMLIGIKGRAGKYLDCLGFNWSPIPCKPENNIKRK